MRLVRSRFSGEVTEYAALGPAVATDEAATEAVAAASSGPKTG